MTTTTTLAADDVGDELRIIMQELLADPTCPVFVSEWGCWMSWAESTKVWCPNIGHGRELNLSLLNIERTSLKYETPRGWLNRTRKAIIPLLKELRVVSLADMCPLNVVNTRDRHFDLVTGEVLSDNDPRVLSTIRLYGRGSYGVPWVDSFVSRHRAAERYVQERGREQIALMQSNGTTHMLAEF